MTIESMINPVDESEMLVAKGVVEAITFKEIIGGPDKYGNTHRASVKIGEEWINNINLKVNADYGPQIRYNAGNKAKPDYQTLEKGDEVRMIVTANPWNGKTYYNGSTSKIKLTKKGAGAPAQKPAHGVSGSVGGKDQYDTTGMEVGHSLNCASQIFGNDLPNMSNTDLLNFCKEIHAKTAMLKAYWKKKNPSMKDKDVGSSAGQAFKMFCLPGNTDLDSIYEAAKNVLENVVPNLTAYVKGEEATPAEAEAAKATPKAQAKPAPKAAPKPKAVEPEPDFGDDDFDDQVPF